MPDESLFDGLTEVVKIGAIADADLFEWVEKNMDAMKRRDADMLEECVARAIQSKAHIVETDENDTVERLLLNFGHTVGHAVESDSDYRISHGKAVSIGMAAEMKLAKFTDADRVLALLDALRMPVAIPVSCSADVLWQSMLTDKKSTGGEVRIAVPVTIGTGAVRSLSREEFKTLFP